MIWLIGNKGMLGTELSLLFEQSGISFTGTDREVDITNREALLAFTETQQKSIDWIVNCAAYTAVDKAEDDKDNCRLINVEGAENIAFAANKIGAKLIHMSTDYVFNGQSNRPYTEEDITEPIGVYGLTKRSGEIMVLSENTKTYIIRTAWLYGKYGANFVHTMLRLMKEKESVSVVNDQRGSPTWAHDLAQVIITLIHLVDEGRSIHCGVYNFTNEADITWFDFAKEIYTQAKALGVLVKNCEVKPCTSSEFPAKVKRPAYSVLDKTKIKSTLGITIPAWDESLHKFLTEIC